MICSLIHIRRKYFSLVREFFIKWSGSITTFRKHSPPWFWFPLISYQNCCFNLQLGLWDLKLGFCLHQGFPGGSEVKASACNTGDLFDPWVREDPLEKAMAPHSSTLAWRIPWREELVGYSPRGRKELDTTQRLHFHFLFKFSFIMIDLPNN